MRVHLHLCSLLLSLWNRNLVKIGLLLLLVFEIVVILKLDQSIFYRITASYTRQSPSYFNTVTLNTKSVLSSLRTQKKSGYLNLHLWSDTCAGDLDILCNLPMFPRAPDKRRLVNETAVIADNLTDVEGIRLLGFISPDKSGFYLFTVRFCSAEVWLSHNENWRNVRKVLDTGLQLKKDLRVSSKIALVAGNKYFIEVVSTCFRKRNKIQLLWKTPMSSAFEIINGSYLSQYVDDTGKNQSLVYDDLLPDSLVCASRRYNRTYFNAQPEMSYLSHDEVKDILPYCEYHPSYTVNQKMRRFQAVTRQVVHSFIYPFPEHMDLKDQKYWIYPLGVNEARNVIDIFTESLHKRMPG